MWKHLIAVCLMAGFGLGGLTLTGCEEDAGDKIEDAADDAGDAIEDAADDVEDAAN